MTLPDDNWLKKDFLVGFDDYFEDKLPDVVAEEEPPDTPPLLYDSLSPPTSPPSQSSARTPGSGSRGLESVPEQSEEEGSDMEPKRRSRRHRTPSAPVSSVKATKATLAGATGRHRLNEESVRPPTSQQSKTKRSWVFDGQMLLDNMERRESARLKSRSIDPSSNASSDTYGGETPAGTSSQRSETLSATAGSVSSRRTFAGSQLQPLRLPSRQEEARPEKRGASSRSKPVLERGYRWVFTGKPERRDGANSGVVTSSTVGKSPLSHQNRGPSARGRSATFSRDTHGRLSMAPSAGSPRSVSMPLTSLDEQIVEERDSVQFSDAFLAVFGPRTMTVDPDTDRQAGHNTAGAGK